MDISKSDLECLKVRLWYVLCVNSPFFFFLIAEPTVTVTHPLVGGSVSEGDVARLECILSSEIKESVTWLKGKEQIHAGGRYEIISDGKKQILIIHAFKPEDQDTYTCMISPEVKSVASLCLEGTVCAFGCC